MGLLVHKAPGPDFAIRSPAVQTESRAPRDSPGNRSGPGDGSAGGHRPGPVQASSGALDGRECRPQCSAADREPVRLRARRVGPARLQPAGARARARGYRAQTRQPARADHGRDGHRQDGDAASAGRGLFGRGRPRVRCRHQGRPLGHRGRGHEAAAPRQARQRDRPRRAFRQRRLPRRVLGRVRPAGPSGACNRAGDGAAAAVAPPGTHRTARGRAQHRLPLGRGRAGQRRSQHGDPRYAGSALHHRRDGQARLGAALQVRQHRTADGGRAAAAPARARTAGRHELLRRARARHHGLPEDGAGRPRDDQHPLGGKADEHAAALFDLPAVDAVGAVQEAARGG